MKTSKIKNIQGAGDFDTHHGKLYSFEYELEDGTILKANHKKTPSPFNIGDEVEYEVTREHPEYGKSGKVRKPNNDFTDNPVHAKARREVMDDSTQRRITFLSVFSSLCTLKAQGSTSVDEVVREAKRVTDIALNGLNSNDTQKNKVEKQMNDFAAQSGTNDLPF